MSRTKMGDLGRRGRGVGKKKGCGEDDAGGESKGGKCVRGGMPTTAQNEGGRSAHSEGQEV